jgi:hypothetical protein
MGAILANQCEWFPEDSGNGSARLFSAPGKILHGTSLDVREFLSAAARGCVELA